MRSQEEDTRQAVKSLERDLINGPRHCFGYHDNCSADFCSTARERLQQMSSSAGLMDKDTMEDPDTDDETDVIGTYMHSSKQCSTINYTEM